MNVFSEPKSEGMHVVGSTTTFIKVKNSTNSPFKCLELFYSTANLWETRKIRKKWKKIIIILFYFFFLHIFTRTFEINPAMFYIFLVINMLVRIKFLSSFNTVTRTSSVEKNSSDCMGCTLS